VSGQRGRWCAISPTWRFFGFFERGRVARGTAAREVVVVGLLTLGLPWPPHAESTKLSTAAATAAVRRPPVFGFTAD
jgi:hypothetical protein